MSLTGRDGGLICVSAVLCRKSRIGCGLGFTGASNDAADARKHDQSLKRTGKR